MATPLLTTGTLPTDETTRGLKRVWHHAQSLTTPHPQVAAFVWPRGGSHHALTIGQLPAVPVGIFESWLGRNIGPAVHRFSKDVGAERVVTVVGWGDHGISVPSSHLDEWKRLVQTEWEQSSTAWLLVSGCGTPGACGKVLSLVHPWRHTRDWRPWKKDARRAPRWSNRKRSIVFRGATTGGILDLDEHSILDDLLRGRLLLALQTSPLPSDGAFNLLVHAREGRKDAIREVLRSKSLLVSLTLSVREMMGFRYQLMVDGHHGAWEAHVWKLLSGSTCLRVESSAMNWYDRFFEPWIHFVPVCGDGSDLLDRYREVLEDEAQARHIAAVCRRRAGQVFRKRFMLGELRAQWRTTWNYLLAE